LAATSIIGGEELMSLAALSEGVPKNVPALICMPLRCTAFDCDGEVARTP